MIENEDTWLTDRWLPAESARGERWWGGRWPPPLASLSRPPWRRRPGRMTSERWRRQISIHDIDIWCNYWQWHVTSQWQCFSHRSHLSDLNIRIWAEVRMLPLSLNASVVGRTFRFNLIPAHLCRRSTSPSTWVVDSLITKASFGQRFLVQCVLLSIDNFHRQKSRPLLPLTWTYLHKSRFVKYYMGSIERRSARLA